MSRRLVPLLLLIFAICSAPDLEAQGGRRVGPPRSTPRTRAPVKRAPVKRAPVRSTPRRTTPRPTTPRRTTPRVTTTPRKTTPRRGADASAGRRITTPTRRTTPRIPSTPRVTTTPRKTTPRRGADASAGRRITTPTRRTTTPSRTIPRTTTPSRSIPRVSTPSRTNRGVTTRRATSPRVTNGRTIGSDARSGGIRSSGTKTPGLRSTGIRKTDASVGGSSIRKTPRPSIGPIRTTNRTPIRRAGLRIGSDGRVSTRDSDVSTRSSKVPSLLQRNQPTRTSRITRPDSAIGTPSKLPAKTPQRRALGSRSLDARTPTRVKPDSPKNPVRLAPRGADVRSGGKIPVRDSNSPALKPRRAAPRVAPRSGTGTAPRLSPRDPSGVAGTSRGPRLGVNAGAAGSAPRLGTQRVGAGFGSRVGLYNRSRNHITYGATAYPHVGLYNRSTLFGSYRYLNGCYHWGLHAGLFWPTYNTWGAYGFGFGWQGSQLCYANTLNPSFVLRWRSWAPYNTTVSWWWPSACYFPGVYTGFTSATALAFGPSGIVDTGGGSAFVDLGAGDPTAVGLDPVAVPADPEPVVIPPGIPLEGAAPVAEPTPIVAKTPAENASLRHLDLGDFYFREMRYDDAAEAYVRALSYTPEDGSIHFVAADALFASADYHYAAYMIRKGLELDPGLAELDADKRLFYEDPATFEGQMEVLSAYIAEKPFDAAARLVMAYNLRYSGRRAEAIPALEKVLEIEPGQYAALVLLQALTKPAEPVVEIR